MGGRRSKGKAANKYVSQHFTSLHHLFGWMACYSACTFLLCLLHHGHTVSDRGFYVFRSNPSPRSSVLCFQFLSSHFCRASSSDICVIFLHRGNKRFSSHHRTFSSCTTATLPPSSLLLSIRNHYYRARAGYRPWTLGKLQILKCRSPPRYFRYMLDGLRPGSIPQHDSSELRPL